MDTKSSHEPGAATRQMMPCTVCGQQKNEDLGWFLIVQGHWNDTLKILAWEDSLADKQRIHRACCPAHVQELVCHWMATGDIEFLLPPEPDAKSLASTPGPTLRAIAESSTEGAREIAELAVDRESMTRILNEQPESLLIILDELRDALERESAVHSEPIESALCVSPSFLKQM